MEPIIKRQERGHYLSFEGMEGSGKSYYLKKLADYSKKEIVPILELSRGGLGEKIIDILSHSSDEFFRHGFPVSEVLFFFAMKTYEFEKTIYPNLEKGAIVIEDRSADTNCLYSGILMQEKYGGDSVYGYYSKLMNLRKNLTQVPEKVVCFVPEFQLALKRAQSRDKRKYNPSELDFLAKIYDGFLELCEKEVRFLRVNVDDQSDEKVLSHLESILDSL